MPLPTVILPGYLESAIAYRQLEESLKQLGFPTVTVPLRRRDWISTLGGRPVTPILGKLDRTVKQILLECNAAQINLIGHSAGGWISRIYLGEKPYLARSELKSSLWKAHPLVATLITLGTPHISQERWTRSTLDFVNNNYPGAFYKNVRYVCVAGKTIFGARRRGSWLAYSSYQLTCGTGNTWGDGITPIATAHLEGAENLVIEGVRHSPRSPGIWYGSPEPLKAWVRYLI
ncbi:triacylglycerol lipase [Nostocaceae cyanobacterium CENA369]|uniref:Triacylglycerol lipase n=1 Tax=Dendronalium phyllosphericum CENA369 TaxID=1725256 RepID=A0A8J7LEA7_9NOST|nr:triacylglycerol lipase [Dendronalium phyllosphericum]MBH8572584.1 triacylglycerol lipase [Dendronalium phyllosphericum CENA369]